MSFGCIYVLVNGAFPGMVKVGKTSGSPEDRARQLSSDTAVPTPFVVAYHQTCADIDRAEQLVHALLDDMGCRVANNREFFRVSATEAIGAVIRVLGRVDGNASAPLAETPHEDAHPDENQDYEAVLEAELRAFEIQTDLEDAAAAAYQGSPTTFRDVNEAIRLYGLAAAHGSSRAEYKLGCIYADDPEVLDNRRALKHLHRAGEHGLPLAYARAALVYLDIGQHDNVIRAWEKAWNAAEVGASVYSGSLVDLYIECLYSGMRLAHQLQLETHYDGAMTHYDFRVQECRERAAFGEDALRRRQSALDQLLCRKSLLSLIVKRKRLQPAVVGRVVIIDDDALWISTNMNRNAPTLGELIMGRGHLIGDFRALRGDEAIEFECFTWVGTHKHGVGATNGILAHMTE